MITSGAIKFYDLFKIDFIEVAVMRNYNFGVKLLELTETLETWQQQQQQPPRFDCVFKESILFPIYSKALQFRFTCEHSNHIKVITYNLFLFYTG